MIQTLICFKFYFNKNAKKKIDEKNKITKIIQKLLTFNLATSSTENLKKIKIIFYNINKLMFDAELDDHPHCFIHV